LGTDIVVASSKYSSPHRVAVTGQRIQRTIVVSDYEVWKKLVRLTIGRLNREDDCRETVSSDVIASGFGAAKDWFADPGITVGAQYEIEPEALWLVLEAKAHKPTLGIQECV
jgi:hypothetical protein